jgi:tetratricopeptide (TPR) repeat protein
VGKTAQESFAEKASLIFEYDHQSPLFVQKASKEIDDQNLDRAMEILRRGLTNYPNHPVALFLIAKILSLQSKFSESLEYYRAGSELIDEPATFLKYQDSVIEIKKLHSPFAMRKATSFAEEPPQTPRKNTGMRKPSFEDRLPDLADQLSKAKLNLAANGESAHETSERAASDHIPIASETLARIYASQGKFEEAIKILQVLSSRNPEKKDHYDRSIAELQIKMLDNS